MTGNSSPRYLPKRNKNMSPKTPVPNGAALLIKPKCPSTAECRKKVAVYPDNGILLINEKK